MQIAEFIQRHPENFIYIFLTNEDLRNFPVNSPVLIKRSKQAPQAAKFAAQAGLTEQQFVNTLVASLKRKYGLTPRQFISQLAKGYNPAPLAGMGSIGDISSEAQYEVDPETGFPIEIIEDSIAAAQQEVAMGAATDGYLTADIVPKNWITPSSELPLPVLSSSASKLTQTLNYANNNGKSVYVTDGKNTYTNIIDQSTGQTKYVMNATNGNTVSVRQSNGKFAAGIQNFKDCWSEIASCSEQISGIFQFLANIIGNIMSLINLCKGNSAVENAEWSPSQADTWCDVRRTTSQTNWAVIALLGLGIYYLSKD